MFMQKILGKWERDDCRLFCAGLLQCLTFAISCTIRMYKIVGIYTKEDVTKTINNSCLISIAKLFVESLVKSLSFWFQVDFGEVFIPPGLDVPRPRVLPEFKRLAHGLRSSNISVLDAKTFYIPNLHYDGAGPDAYFWVGNGSKPNIMGIKVIEFILLNMFSVYLSSNNFISGSKWTWILRCSKRIPGRRYWNPIGN